MMTRAVLAVAVVLSVLVGGSAGASQDQVEPRPAAPPPGTAYLGGFVDPSGKVGSGIASPTIRELAELGPLEGQIGAPLGIVKVFQDWTAYRVHNSTLDAIASQGAIPAVIWDCFNPGSKGVVSIPDTSVTDGSEDATITAYADQLKAYGKPVFLFWFREPNLGGTGNNNSYKGCLQSNPSTYAPAWQHIYDIFQQQGATNVAFVFCPGMGGATDLKTLSELYPGPNYVNWIGLDGYSRDSTQDGKAIPADPSFTQLFGAVYSTLSNPSFGDPPMMVSETGADGVGSDASHQTTYLQSALSALGPNGAFPRIQGFVYFDAINWRLTNGMSSFAEMAQSPFFSQ